jgi:hypothetical protein
MKGVKAVLLIGSLPCARFPKMKTLNLLRPFRSSRGSRGYDLEGNPAHANSHPAEKASGDAEQQSASSPSTLPPPPYQSSRKFVYLSADEY